MILPFQLWFLFLFAGPLGILVVMSFFARNEFGVAVPAFSFSSYRELLDPIYLQIIGRTLGLAFANTLSCILIAYPLAFYFSRLPKRRAATYLAIVMIPFWTNFLIRILAFLDVLRMTAPFGFNFIYTLPGVLLAMIYNYLPFAILPLYTSLEKIDTALIEAALDLGASRWQIIWRILWPMSRTGVLSAGALVFIPSMGEFLIPDLVGGGQKFFVGTFLYHQFFVARNWPLGAAAIVTLILTASVGLGLVRWALALRPANR